MANKIKEMSKFSEDAIAVAMDNLPNEEKQKLLTGLNSLSAMLGKKLQKQTEGKKTKVTDDSIFLNFILPQIQKKISMIEADEMNARLELSTGFTVETNYDTLSVTQLKEIHANILRQEERLKDATLLVQYFRGQLYLTLNRKVRKEHLQWMKFVEADIKCSYSTVLRYMTLATFISSYPRLLLCSLSFAQILKHRDRISKYLETANGIQLRDQLEMSFDLSVNEKIIHIGCQKLPIPPKHRHDFNPDWEFLDAQRIEAPNQNMERWVESVGACNTDSAFDEIAGMENYLSRSLSLTEDMDVKTEEDNIRL